MTEPTAKCDICGRHEELILTGSQDPDGKSFVVCDECFTKQLELCCYVCEQKYPIGELVIYDDVFLRTHNMLPHLFCHTCQRRQVAADLKINSCDGHHLGMETL